MARTTIQNLVTGTISSKNVVIMTVATDDVGSGDVFENADTERICGVNGIVKYINIKAEIAVRPGVGNQEPGWFEYAFVFLSEQDNTDPVVDPDFQNKFGVSTIGEIADKFFTSIVIGETSNS